jgi:hypothetical protein
MTMVYDTPPPFFSREFHIRFFLQILKSRLLRKKGVSRGTGFNSTMEMFLGLAVCVVLAIIGIPSAWTQGSIVGWILSIIGVGGIVVLIIISVGSQWGSQPSYDDFLTGVFSYFFCLGLFAGIPVGMEYHDCWLGIAASLAGLIAGYLLGIVAGLRLQHLGWIAVIINMLAVFGTVVLCGTALVMLVILLF